MAEVKKQSRSKKSSKKSNDVDEIDDEIDALNLEQNNNFDDDDGYRAVPLERIEMSKLARGISADREKEIIKTMRETGFEHPTDKAKTVFIKNVNELADWDPKLLSQCFDRVTVETAMKFINKAQELSSVPLHRKASTFKRRRLGVRLDIDGFDALFEGFIRPGESILIWGKPGEGKSQLLYETMAACGKLRENGGLQERGSMRDFMLFDTEGNAPNIFDQVYLGQQFDEKNFDLPVEEDKHGFWGPSRFETFCLKRNIDSEIMRDHIYVTLATSCNDMLTKLQYILDHSSEYDYCFIGMDSISNLMRGEFPNRQDLPKRAQFIAGVSDMLHKLKNQHDAVLVATTQVSSVPDVVYGGDQEVPVGGNTLMHRFNQVVRVKKVGKYHIAYLTDSNNHPTNKRIAFTIGQRGIEDYNVLKEKGKSMSKDQRESYLKYTKQDGKLTFGNYVNIEYGDDGEGFDDDIKSPNTNTNTLRNLKEDNNIGLDLEDLEDLDLPENDL